MFLCSTCRDFVQSFDPISPASEPHQITRSAKPFKETSFSCRICAVVWAQTDHRSRYRHKVDQSIHLSLVPSSTNHIVLEAETEGSGGTFMLQNKYHKIPPKDIRAFLQAHDLKDDPQKYLTNKFLTIKLKRHSGESALRSVTRESYGSEENDTGIRPEERPLTSESPRIDFFKRFLPELRQWLGTCDQHHSPCRERRTSNVLPTRLLYVGKQPGELCLCRKEQIASGSRYLTMSYRWGRDSTMCLKQNNLHDWLIRIPEDELPQTLKDGVDACRLLRCEYILIDALCIIQDCHDDWLRESALMDSIYSGSHLNLAASSAGNVDRGLFVRCNELLSDGKPLTVQLADGNLYTQMSSTLDENTDSGSSDWLETRKLLYDLFREDFEKSILHGRGWVFQVSSKNAWTILFQC